ncbi:stalk domain-containing protein [Paenibacillus tyrfis]|uniref:stalk domain-containing protein n=1 Tax=Paenibacillus tyrfis TaxID=1501230 RepID=UPI00209EC4B6|nr:stalk domain-containing protein [Paenibacillus tyrfis]MCP1308875.1 stalk domain-containing protein [Paenibacillus tyrfis]
MKSSLFNMAACAVLLLTLGTGTAFSAADNAVVHEQRKVSYDGSYYTLDLIRVNLKDPTIQVKAVAANRKIGSVQNFAEMMSNNHAVAGINGTFFDAFTEDIDYRTPYGVLMNNNDLFYSGDKDVSITVSADKEARIERLAVGSSVQMGRFASHLNAVDQYYGDEEREAWVFTKDYGDVADEPGVKIVIGEDQKVRSISSEPVMIPPGGKVVLLSTDRSLEQVSGQIKVGDKFSMNQSVTNADSKQAIPLQRYQLAIGAGPKLLTGGNVDIDFERDGFNDPLVTSQANVRSFAGVDGQGRLVMGTISYSTIEQMAHVLLEAGITDAINLDGGASSALYYQGKMLRKPGRLLSNALIVQQKEQPQVQLSVNGQLIAQKTGYIDRGVTMVPFRVLLNRMKAEYLWHAEDSSLHMTSGTTKVELKPGSSTAIVNGQPMTLDAEPKMVDGRIFVPLRFVAESLGAKVQWDDVLYRAEVTLPEVR